jgi:hypothetical protein
MNFKGTLIAMILAASFCAFSQEEKLQTQLDSIVQEADLLYNYEKLAWNASDIFMASDAAKNPIGGYVVYHAGDSLYASFLNDTTEKVLACYTFSKSDVNTPSTSNYEPRALTDVERELFDQKKGHC